jgi:hypothetical protein
MRCRIEKRDSAGRLCLVVGRLALAALATALTAAPAAAQDIVVKAGAEPEASVAPGDLVPVPVIVDMADAAGLNIASLTFVLDWDPSKLAFVDLNPTPPFGSLTCNLDDVGNGQLVCSWFDFTGHVNTFTLTSVTFQTGPFEDPTPAVIGLDVTAAGDELGNNILANVAGRGLNLCIGLTGLLGDVNGDDVVNIIDAQQIARFSVGLPVTDPERVLSHGDVNEDGVINIIDAQQVARYSVGLPTDGSPNLGLPIPGGCDIPPDGVVHDLVVRHYITTTLTDEDADRILSDGTEVLQVNHGPGDVACDVTTVRDGPITSFDVGDGSIDSEAEIWEVLNLPGHTKVVNEINWCGSPGPGIIGCAPTPGTSYVVVRFTENQEGILWTHEFGHNKGLPHREGIDLLMNPYISPTNNRINDTECTAFRQ